MTPQPPAKSEDELLAETLNGILHPDNQESFDNLVNGLACHYERLGKGITTPHTADKYTLEYVYGQLKSLFKQEAEAHATKHLLNLIGPNEPVDGFSKDLNRSVRPAARNEVRDELRAKIEAWAGGEA